MNNIRLLRSLIFYKLNKVRRGNLEELSRLAGEDRVARETFFPLKFQRKLRNEQLLSIFENLSRSVIVLFKKKKKKGAGNTPEGLC